MPFFSIIIPTFNSALVIEKVISSILKQSYSDYEIIIQDGGSKDNTEEIVQSFADNKIQFFTEQDNGVYDAMNKAIANAKGTWLLFLGSDDFLLDNHVLMDISQSAISSNMGVIYGDVVMERTGAIYDGPFSLEKIFLKNICHQSMFYHRSLFQKYKGYDISIPINGDYDFNLKLFIFKEPFKYINRTIALFADGGLSAVGKDQAFNNIFPIKVSNYIADSARNTIQKIYLMSFLFCRLLLKYNTVKLLRNKVFSANRPDIKIAGFGIIPIIYPWYLMNILRLKLASTKRYKTL